jgi:DNA-3-methyladenine glycosylase I
MVEYHDSEWGVPSRDERHLFELLTLESAQSGLSWSTVLAKREGYRRAFAGFDAEVVARFGPDEVAGLLSEPAIIRNRAKIEATVGNARVLASMHERGELFADLLWSSVGGISQQNAWREQADVPASTPEAAKLASALKIAGIRFVGPTVCYSLMQAAGLVNDHLVTCYRWAALSS